MALVGLVVSLALVAGGIYLWLDSAIAILREDDDGG